MLSERQVRRLREEAARQDRDAEAAFRDAVNRDAAGKPIGLRPEALPHITTLARNGRHTSFIASRLGLTAKQFKHLMGSGDAPTDVRLAFERGHVDHEANIEAMLLEHGKKWAPSLMYLSKSRLGWRETESVVDIRNEDNRKIQITMPKALGFGEMLSALGQKEVMDFRKDKSVPLKDVLPSFAQIGGVEHVEEVLEDRIEPSRAEPGTRATSSCRSEPAPAVTFVPQPEAEPLSVEEFEELQRKRTAAAFAKANGITR